MDCPYTRMTQTGDYDTMTTNGNSWWRFAPFANYGARWFDKHDVGGNDVKIDNIGDTYVETGETRDTSPNGEQCTIQTPWFDGQTCFIETTETLYGIREPDDTVGVWVMHIQIEMLV